MKLKSVSLSAVLTAQAGNSKLLLLCFLLSVFCILSFFGCGGGNSSQTGSLYISSTPSGAAVILDNENKGSSPLTLNNVTVGLHSLKLTSELYKENSQTVVIETNKTTTVNISLEAESYPTNPW